MQGIEIIWEINRSAGATGMETQQMEVWVGE